MGDFPVMGGIVLEETHQLQLLCWSGVMLILV